MLHSICLALLLTAARAAADEATPSVTDLAWLCGHYSGEALGGDAEETWSAPEAGTMIGMFRLIQDGQLKVIEFITIADSEAGVILRFHHFHTDLSTWEETPLTFHLTDVDEEFAVFESTPNSPPGTPHSMTYQIVDHGNLEVTVASSDADDHPMTLTLKRGTVGE